VPTGDGVRKGRGAATNRSGRFDELDRESFDDGWGSLDEPAPTLETVLAEDASRSALSYNDSPDIPFDRSVNPYRGCEHGCIYCYARPSHAWLGLSPGLDFETRLFHKPRTAEWLRAELRRPGYRPAPIALGANTDVYQPVERRLRITRAVLELLADTGHPLRIVTKSALVERDLDLLAVLAEQHLVTVHLSITSLDRRLTRRMEPRAAAPERRLKTISRLHEAGVPVGVLVAPVIPALTDAELENILEAARGAGAGSARYVTLRLPREVAGLFTEWLEHHFPLRASHVLARVRDLHGGRAYDGRFGRRMRGEGPFAELLRQRFAIACRRLGFGSEPPLDTSRFEPPAAAEDRQLRLL
jgi:DNA repair photolyase